ncbi:leucine-zipper-like transcriptional regulator 1 [Lampris incognitus]|uniref:leucine-zipper-like transcriptional regulator 1 n=1 Tax=Lampris incognitus TaxID=2546036 RepID=UPI0024B5438E|nr:leucine-zipper-like transcriptional regulator 1 [Lampris incognitus]XP_056145608.1 leucine-zipper-like transcriptional regulator 1 [Lampris incognitus]XP_056145609.1 leucine-zipper-like transcriptional regulator 1 [Lampris incognitus]XP_056145610.1 leucine-zipper-like transcriptional regulator 1 [Lampris incognitus]
MPTMSQKSPCLWTPLPQGSPAPCDRYKHACCTYSGDVYVLGGRDSSCLGDLWRYTVALNEWTELVCTSEAAPDELEEHSMVAHEGFLYVFGGMLDSAYTEWRCPLWVFDITKQKWIQWQGKKSSPQSQMPTNRKGHSAVVFGSAMFVYGGYIDMRGSTQEFWTLDFDTMAWSLLDSSQQVSMGPGPGPRHCHSAVAYQDCMYLFGGLRGLREQRDLWMWNSTSHTWSCLKAMSGPSKLVGHSAVAYKDSMLVFGGGESQSCPMNSLWRYSFTTLNWERLAVLPGSNPPPRIHHCCAGLGPSYQAQTSPSYSVSHGASSRPQTGLMDSKLRPFKNKCFPLPLTYLGTEGAIELETFSSDKSCGASSYTDSTGVDYSNGSLTGKDAQRIKSCLTFENQAFSKKWSYDEEDSVDIEDSITQHLPDLLLVLGGKPLNRHMAISVWQMTLTDS